MRQCLSVRWVRCGFFFLWCLVPLTALAVKDGAPRSKVDLIVLHATGGPACNEKTKTVYFTPAGTPKGMKKHFEEHKTVSIHYIVGKEGEILSSIPENKVAIHVRGKGLNERSIGIEMINQGDGKDRYPEKQVKAVTELLSKLVKKYKLQRSQIAMHSDLDRSEETCGTTKYKRKQDPGDKFPMEEILNAVFAKR